MMLTEHTTPVVQHKSIRRLLEVLASLRLTVALIALGIGLIFAGTLAQVDKGVWTIVHTYFRSVFVFIPLQIFVPRSITLPGAFPYPGGYTLGTLALVNLLAAHTLRFRVVKDRRRMWIGFATLALGAGLITWFHKSSLPAEILTRAGGYAGVLPLLAFGALFYAPCVAGAVLAFGRRGGVVLIHVALLLLIAGEAVTALGAVETQMPIYEGTSTQWAQDIRESELAIIDSSDPQTDRTTVLPQSALRHAARTGEPISNPNLPFTITVDKFFKNSDPVRATEPGVGKATSGLGTRTSFVSVGEASGVDPDQRIDVPAALVTFTHEGKELGTYWVSPHFQQQAHMVTLQDVDVGGTNYGVALRFRRYYRPYTMFLKEFRHDLYPGTQVPRNFSSEIRLTDPETGEDRDVIIKMNHPLRYRGETYFQSGWIPGRTPAEPDRGTILMVVRNPGWIIPYIACALGTIGLMLHFSIGLRGFLRKRTAT